MAKGLPREGERGFRGLAPAHWRIPCTGHIPFVIGTKATEAVPTAATPDAFHLLAAPSGSLVPFLRAGLCGGAPCWARDRAPGDGLTPGDPQKPTGRGSSPWARTGC